MSEAARRPAAKPRIRKDPELFINRELSWLEFNHRVLEEAMDPATPLLDRLKFAIIVGSNLDEFFMVRVAGLKRWIATGLAVRTAAGIEPRELIERIARLAHELMQQHAAVFQHDVRPALEDQGIAIVRWDELDDAAHPRDRARRRHSRLVVPVTERHLREAGGPRDHAGTDGGVVRDRCSCLQSGV